MSTTNNPPRLDLSAYAWKATKMAVGGVVFIAMSLPIAFPAKVGNPAATPMSHQQSSASTRAEAPGGRIKASSPAKVEAAQAPLRKPQPKNA